MASKLLVIFIVYAAVFLGVLSAASVEAEADGDDAGSRRRSDDALVSQLEALVQTQAQQISELKAETAALKSQTQTNSAKLAKLAEVAYFTAYVTANSQARHGNAVMFDRVKADSANAYDVTHRAYVIPYTGVYWVSLTVDVIDDTHRMALELYANNKLLGSADAADVSEAIFTGAFQLQKGDRLVVKRAHDIYNSDNLLQSRTMFSVAMVQAI